MVRTLCESMRTEVIVPVLAAGTRDECLQIVGATWHSFCETLRSLHVLIARASSERRAIELAGMASHYAADRIRLASQGLAGPAGEHEADFALSTYDSARLIVTRYLIQPNPPPAEEARARDKTLARAFNDSAAFHVLGNMLIDIAASERDARYSKESISVAFELMRGGAIEAYAAAREAYGLRTGNGEADPTSDDDEEELTDPLHEAAPISPA